MRLNKGRYIAVVTVAVVLMALVAMLFVGCERDYSSFTSKAASKIKSLTLDQLENISVAIGGKIVYDKHLRINGFYDYKAKKSEETAYTSRRFSRLTEGTNRERSYVSLSHYRQDGNIANNYKRVPEDSGINGEYYTYYAPQVMPFNSIDDDLFLGANLQNHKVIERVKAKKSDEIGRIAYNVTMEMYILGTIINVVANEYFDLSGRLRKVQIQHRGAIKIAGRDAVLDIESTLSSYNHNKTIVKSRYDNTSFTDRPSKLMTMMNWPHGNYTEATESVEGSPETTERLINSGETTSLVVSSGENAFTQHAMDGYIKNYYTDIDNTKLLEYRKSKHTYSIIGTLPDVFQEDDIDVDFTNPYEVVLTAKGVNGNMVYKKGHKGIYSYEYNGEVDGKKRVVKATSGLAKENIAMPKDIEEYTVAVLP